MKNREWPHDQNRKRYMNFKMPKTIFKFELVDICIIINRVLFTCPSYESSLKGALNSLCTMPGYTTILIFIVTKWLQCFDARKAKSLYMGVLCPCKIKKFHIQCFFNCLNKQHVLWHDMIWVYLIYKVTTVTFMMRIKHEHNQNSMQ